MLKKWISLMLVALTLLAVAPVAMADPVITEDSIVIIVNVKNYANVHEKASKESAVLGWAPRGKSYKLLAAEGSYYKIQYTKEKVGYVHQTLSKVGKKGDEPKPGTATLVNEPASGNGVNIRSSASSKSSSNIVGVAHNGDTFEVTGKKGKWTKVIYKGKTAYIFTAYLSISGGGDGSSDVTPMSDTKAYIDCNYQVNVRAKASSKSKKLGTLKKGSEVTVTGTTSKWTRIKYKGDEAFVYSTYVSYTKPISDDEAVGKTATVVNCNYCVNVRAKATKSSKKLGTADKGSTWTIKGISGNWVKIDYHGEIAFIYKKYIKIS